MFRALNYLEHLFILASTVTVCVSLTAFPLLVDVPLGTASYAAKIKIFVTIAWVKQL